MAALVTLTACSGAPPPAPVGDPTEPLPTLAIFAETPEPAAATEAPEDGAPVDPMGLLVFHQGWARLTLPNPFGGAGVDQMNAVAAGEPGIVAVGYTERAGEIDGAAWFSADGLSWTRVDDPAALGGPGLQTIHEVGYGPGGFVAVGSDRSAQESDAAVWFSTDGQIWRRVSSGSLGGPGDQVLNDVTAFGDGFIAVGKEEIEGEIRGAVWVSPEGSSWQRAAHSEEIFGGAGRYVYLKSVLAVGGTLIAAGNVQPADQLDVDAAVWVSEDGGQTWAPVQTQEAMLGDPGPVRFQSVSAIAQGSDGFLLAGAEQNLPGSPSGKYDNIVIWSSQDGLDWSRIFDHKPDLREQSLLDIVVTTFGVLAAGYDLTGDRVQAAVWFSDVGSVWTQVDHSESVFGGPGIQRIHAIVEGGPGLVAVGSTTEAGDTDAAVWIFMPGRQ